MFDGCSDSGDLGGRKKSFVVTLHVEDEEGEMNNIFSLSHYVVANWFAI